MKSVSNIISLWNKMSLVKRILTGLIAGVILGLTLGDTISGIGILGKIFVGALKAVAPILVFFIVMSAISQHKEGQKTNIKDIVFLYLLGTFLAGLAAVGASFIFPVTLELGAVAMDSITPPSGITEVLTNLLLNLVDNPVSALANANYIGILAWAILLGLALRYSSENTKACLADISDALSNTVRFIISFAPLGIMGLVYSTIIESGIEAFKSYGQLVIVLVGTMFFVALVLNPIITYICIRQNPYPLVLKCLKESGLTAFFTRSSAANIPVNMALCERLGLDKNTYSISIPLGSTVNMGGAAVTISVLSLATANTLGIYVDFPTAVVLSIMSAISACGTSGVAGGSILLIPLACSLFGIPSDISIQVVGIGFIIGVLQDSCETAINSSTDVLFTAISEFKSYRKEGKTIIIN